MNILNRSHLRIKNSLPYFKIPEMEKIGWLCHGFLTRQGGVSSPPYDSLNLSDNNGDRGKCVTKNKKLIATAFGFDPRCLILLDQMHRDQILVLKKPVATRPSPLEYDALITNSPNMFLGILTADCIPIFAVDQKRGVIAAIHAGRQGTGLNITTKVLKKMGKEFGCSSENLLIVMGPCIGPCCYEIDEKTFHAEWEPFSTPRGKGRWRVDLAGINIAQMRKEGVKEKHIYRIDLCNSCHSDLLFSYRKEGRTGRQLSFIGIME